MNALKSLFTSGKALTILLIVLLSGSIVALAYTVAVPPIIDRFTEFYVLGLEGKAGGYPSVLKVREEGRVLLGITNKEHKQMTYSVKIKDGDNIIRTIESIMLEQGETWEEEVGFSFKSAGADQKVDFLLLTSGNETAYRRLHLIINVE